MVGGAGEGGGQGPFGGGSFCDHPSASSIQYVFKTFRILRRLEFSRMELNLWSQTPIERTQRKY
jgi:hypothetical protein